MEHNQCNITKYVKAIISEEGIQLTYNNQVIGRILWKDISNIELSRNYILRDRKIYRKTNNHSPVSTYLENCDLGWC